MWERERSRDKERRRGRERYREQWIHTRYWMQSVSVQFQIEFITILWYMYSYLVGIQAENEYWIQLVSSIGWMSFSLQSSLFSSFFFSLSLSSIHFHSCILSSHLNYPFSFSPFGSESRMKVRVVAGELEKNWVTGEDEEIHMKNVSGSLCQMKRVFSISSLSS